MLKNIQKRSIKSLIEQSLEDIEIILVNDGSKDGSEEIAKEYKRKYPDKDSIFGKKKMAGYLMHETMLYRMQLGNILHFWILMIMQKKKCMKKCM